MSSYYISFPHATSVYEDSWTLIRSMGGQKIQVGNYYEGNALLPKIKRNMSLLLDLIKLRLKRFHKDDNVFVLIPYNLPLQNIFYKALLSKNVRLHLTMIDLTKARMSSYYDVLEKKVCKKSTSMIVQTEEMKDAMLQMGYISSLTKIMISHFWPILTDMQPSGQSLFGNSIAFSGALNKAPFVSMLSSLDERLDFTVNPSFRMITEDWGLVWDGDSLETCTGRFGNYMRMVFPYKASLYLASNRPLIVWKECAIADFVLDNHLGVVVNNLHELYEAIASVSEEEKMLIRKNVYKWCAMIRKGTERTEMIKKMITNENFIHI